MIRLVVACSVGIAVLVSVFLLGFLTQRFHIQPFDNFSNRVEHKLGKISGQPSAIEQKVAQIETTFVRLKGKVFGIPNNDYINGGSMTVWGDDLLIVQRTGRILRFDDVAGRIVETGITPPENGVKAYITISAQSEYANYIHKPNKIRFNDITYVDTPQIRGLALSYTFFDPDRICYGTRVAWLALSNQLVTAASLKATAAEWEIVFETTPCLQLNPNSTALEGILAGGRMSFQAPSNLILGSGDYYLDGVHTYDVGVQSDDTDYGKVIAIDLSNRTSRHLSKGHRNLQGVVVDKTGRIWTTEHGVRGGDELNLIKEGENYGWPLETLGTLYSGQPWPTKGEDGRHVLHIPPVFAWLPSAAISALTVIDGFHPTWDGDLLASSLSSKHFGQSLFRIRIRGERVIFVERIELGMRIRYVTQYGPDRIAVWTDKNELVLFSIAPRSDPLGEAVALLDDKYEAQLSAQIRQRLRSCSECHSFEHNNHASAPSLNGAVGRGIGASGYAYYSDALKNISGRWTTKALRHYLIDPQAFAKGTSMPEQNLGEGPVLDGLIWTLEQINSSDDEHMTYN